MHFYRAARYRVTFGDPSRSRDLYFGSATLTAAVQFCTGVLYLLRDFVRDYCRILRFFNSKRYILERGVNEDGRCVVRTLYAEAPNFSWDRLIQTMVADRRTRFRSDRALRRRWKGIVTKYTYRRRGFFIFVRYFRIWLRFFTRRFNPLYKQLFVARYR